MKERLDLIALFENTFRREVNIGDEIELSYLADCDYYAYKDGMECGKRANFSEEKVDRILSYVSPKLAHRPVIMDLNDDFFGGAKARVIIATKTYYVVKIDDVRKDAWFDQLHQETFEEECHCSFEDMILREFREALCEEEEKEEEGKMFSELGTSFGKINSNQFKISVNGLTVRNKEGKYVTFNPETRELVEVTNGFFDDMSDLLFLMPATELEVGDIILHQGKPYFITAAREGNIRGVDFEEAVENTLIPKTNVFGVKYFTKVFNCLGTNNILGGDLATNPMMTYALMGGKDFDLSKVMMFQALSGQGNGVADFSENPVMLMALMGNGGELNDFAKMQILTQLSAPKKRKKDKENTN